MAEEHDDAIRRLAENQHGLITRRQAQGMGVPLGALRHRVDCGALERVSDTVLRVAGTPKGPVSRVMAAVLDAGPTACASHWTAVALWDVPGGLLHPVHVTAGRSTIRRSPYLGMIHQPRSMRAAHVASRHGITVTTPARTVFDIASLQRVWPERIEQLLDAVLARNLATLDRFERTLDEVAARGRRGIALMRRLLEARRDGQPPPATGLEFRFRQLAREAGLPELVRQLDVGDDDDWIGRMDFVDRSRRLIVETDTVLHHGTLSDRRRDEARRSALRRGGWTVLVFTDIDVFHRAHEVVRELRALRRGTELAG